MGSTTNQPVSLAPFAFDWVGGDIHGLQALSIKLSSYVPAIIDVITALDRRAAPKALRLSVGDSFCCSQRRCDGGELVERRLEVFDDLCRDHLGSWQVTGVP
jgi:hypothetical protein